VYTSYTELLNYAGAELIRDEKLRDSAPVLELLGLEKLDEMTGKSLV